MRTLVRLSRRSNPGRARRTQRALASALAVAALGCTGVVTTAGGSDAGRPGGSEQPPVLDAATDAGEQPPPCTVDCVERVFVPAGSFLMGAVSIPGESKPQHTVSLSAGFWLDKHEVSMRRYDQCVQAGACPGLGGGFDANSDAPAHGVEWEAARTYCEWAGKRLPTEAEWEHAACGDGMRCYPWGGDKQGSACTEEPDCSMAAFCPDSQCASGPCFGNPQDVDDFADRNLSFYGAVNMGGNVWEWVEDAWTPNFEWCGESCADPIAPAGSSDHVMKGGSWVSEEVFLRCAARYRDGSGGFPVSEVGIRCAQTAAD